MIRFILALYIISANGLVIPDAVWAISWVALALVLMSGTIKFIGECTK